MIQQVINPEYSHYLNLPPEQLLFNPLTDVPVHFKEQDMHAVQREMVEFYKLCNEYYSPEFGIKYLLNVNLYPFQMATIRAILGHKFPMLLFTRGGGKTFLIAVYAIYHAIMFPFSRIVLVSASFRQSKLIFAEIERIYKKSPLLRMISENHPSYSTDHCHYELCGSSIKALPLGTGDKIRGERGHVILTDEFDAIPIEIFDVVVRGFGATHADPWSKTRDILLNGIQEEQQKKGVINDADMARAMLSTGNKIILSGTAGFKGGTFYKLFSQYSRIIHNKIKGKAEDYQTLLEDENIADDVEIDCRDYCIIRFNYTELPMGMQDTKLIQNAKATMPEALFRMEYMAEFADDSFGFFKPRDINAATAKPPGFGPRIRGGKSRHYIMGIDPARTSDRFAISIIELGTPNKVVYCWTCQNQHFTYAAAQIRKLLRWFNVEAIAMDEGGGGYAMEELINKADVMEAGEQPIFRFDDDSPEAEKGKKILYMFSFNSNWIDEANALLQKNIEDRVIMFPVGAHDGKFSDEIDDVIYEIAEMKKELVAIEVTHTKSGKKHFDLAPPDPRKDVDGAVKHKDRYSSLLLANYVVSRWSKLNYDEKAAAREIYERSVNFGRWL